MIFYVYLAPEVIKSAQEAGSQSIQALIGIMRGLSKNCFLVDFDNCYVENQIRDLLEDLLGEYDIIVLKKLLAHFLKQNLFVNCLEYSYEADVLEIDMVAQQCEKHSLDLLLLADAGELTPDLPIEVATLSNYQISNFESVRSDYATVGITLAAASMKANDFLENYLKKALKYAQTIEVFDYLSGEQYKSNYDYSLKIFLGWLKNTNKEDLRITIHCGYPNDQSNLFARDEFDDLDSGEIELMKKEKLSQAINGHYGKSTIRVVCYENKFAHDRFIITNQIAFSIGIGMDFLHHSGTNKGTIRDITINLKDSKDVRNLISGTN